MNSVNLVNWINMSAELNGMLYGDEYGPPQGHWIVLRWFHIGTYSKYWDPVAKQAIGGPKWKYTDFPIRTTYKPLKRDDTAGVKKEREPGNLPGTVEVDERMYILQRCFRPKPGDIIFEFKCDYPDKVEDFLAIANKAPRDGHIIYSVETVRPERSTIGYFLAYTRRHNRGY